MTSIVAANRRDRKKASTRKSIVAAALDLFEASGYDNVTVDQIAEQSDVSPRTLYRYFPTKSAIVFEVQASWMAVFAKVAGHPEPGDELLAHMRRIAASIAAHVVNDPASARRVYAIVQDSIELQALSIQWERDWRTVTATVLAVMGRDRAEVVAGIVMGMISANLGLWLRNDDQTDLVRMISDGFDLIESGLAPR